MAEWALNMQSAPRGSYDVIPAGKKGEASRKVFRREYIIAAGASGVVNVSYFIHDDKRPERSRWSMYEAGTPPIAWMPYAGPETVVDEDGKARKVVRLPKHPTMATSWFDDLLASRRAAA